jgi:hypothetical protein
MLCEVVANGFAERLIALAGAAAIVALVMGVLRTGRRATGGSGLST